MVKKVSLWIGALFALCLPMTNASAESFLTKLKKGVEEVGKSVDKINDATKGISSKTRTSSQSSSVASAPSPRDGKLRTLSDVEGVTVKVKKCYRDDNDNVTLVFTLLNESGSRAVCQLRCGDSVVYDDEGNSYKEDRLRFSSMDGMFQEVWDAELPKDIAVKYRMRIKDVDPDAAVLKQVSIYMYQLPIGSMNGKVHLYNVPISRPGD